MNYTGLPHPRSGHTAIIYKTFNTSWCIKYNHKCVREKKNDEKCKAHCSTSPENKKKLLAKQWDFIADNRRLQPWWNITAFKDICPPACCRIPYDIECKQFIDASGQSIIPEEEIMLVYGGITSRRRFINGTKISVFDQCEYYDEKYEIPAEGRPFTFKNCGEEVLGDLW